ncbi:MAG: hypothetical protein MK066_02855 [Crocinitomicaceae bacterium]|nr:hypothetical protein [Crocinitomicaceae bacterium]
MKNTRILLTMLSLSIFSFGQDIDSTGLEGDNLDLNGVLELFHESESIEDFEKKLNTESNGVNNLDLNEDGEVDYIKVVDHADSTSHALALQVPVSESESQDVAAIEIEQTDSETTKLQVIGDAELYGEEYMIEPQNETNKTIVVNVNTWRPIRYIYGPRYVPYRSPYRWGVFPRWYRPWRRVGWAVYRPRVRRYHRPCYRRTRVRRCVHIHNHYHKHHVHSKTFHASHHHKHTKKAVGPAHNKSHAKTNAKKTPNGGKGKNVHTTHSKTQTHHKTVKKSSAPTHKAQQKKSTQQKSKTSPHRSSASPKKKKANTSRSTSGTRSKSTKAKSSRGKTRKGRR